MIDARRLSCPEPVVLVKKALETKQAHYEIWVDTAIAMENVSKFGRLNGYEVKITEESGEYKLVFDKK